MKPHDEHEDREVTVETLHSPPVQIQPASLVRRFTATALDSLIIVFTWLALIAATGRDFSNLNTLARNSGADLCLVLLTFTYYFVCEGLFAATIGKAALRLRVFTKEGDLCSFSPSFKRNVLRFVDWLPIFYFVGAIAVLATSKRQRIGDILAMTIVSRALEKDINPPPAPFFFH